MPSPVSEGEDVRVGVLALVERENRVLFERRTADEEATQYWGLLAGGKRADESTVAAAKREVHEETGLTFQPERVVGLFDHESYYGSGTTWTVVALAGPADGDPDPDHEPGNRDRLSWFSLDDPPTHCTPRPNCFSTVTTRTRCTRSYRPSSYRESSTCLRPTATRCRRPARRRRRSRTPRES